ncbi:MAG: PilW family protein [Nevskiales bacterium]
MQTQTWPAWLLMWSYKVRHKPTSHNGFTLVELLIALAISLFLLAALVQIMASSSAAFRTNEGVSRIQEGGRFAMEIIGRQVRNAGYHSDNISQNLSTDLASWPLNTAAAPGDFAIEGTDGAAGVGGAPDAPDTLFIRYYIPSDCTQDACVNAPININDADINPDEWIEVQFSVDADRILRCNILDDTGTNNSISGGNQPLLEGVTNMQVIYGVNVGGNMRYNTATTVTANGDWPNVVSVRVNLTLDSIDAVTTQAGADNVTDGRLERPYSATFTVRNRMAGA